MSEYWVSHKKYYCKYCETYIAEDAPSRAQHENGLRHKGNKERFVRNLYKQSEKKKHDAEEERREMARVDQAARAAFAQDVAAGRSKASSSTLPPLPPPKPAAPAAPKPASAWTNYSSAASLGLTDPDAERAAAEAERKRTQGTVGVWEVVAAPASVAGEDVEDGVKTEDGQAGAGRKRAADAPPAEEEEDARAFKLRKKAWGAPGALGGLWDPESAPIRLKPKKAEPVLDAPGAASTSSVLLSGPSESASVLALDAPAPADGSKPKWTARGWNAGSASSTPFDPAIASATVGGSPAEADDGLVKAEDSPLRAPAAALDNTNLASPAVIQEDAPVKVEEPALPPPEATPTGNLFKKRKAPATSAGTRRK